jgi:putative oxidoreductase
MNRFFSSSPIFPDKGLALVRIIIGAFLIYHGLEVFDAEIMKGYMGWETFKGPAATVMVYAGKLAELIAGILIFFGFFTRIGSILTLGTFLYITFFVGHGKFWYEDQHPFLFLLFGLLFLFTGPGAWSLDALIFKGRTSN